jgi:SAM-dependent methyltransferase
VEKGLLENMNPPQGSRRNLVAHFDVTAKAYDEWYDAHPALYRSELAAVRKAVPPGTGLEVGVGTGRFAAPLGIEFGLDLSFNALAYAQQRGIKVVQGDGYALPFRPGMFDVVLIVFVLELVGDTRRFLVEAAKALRKHGVLILGFIDKDRPWGRHFLETSELRPYAWPPSPGELVGVLGQMGMSVKASFQTLFGPPPDLKSEEEPRPGFGEGGFVVFKAVKGG